jgi:uncharacterized repeat protein (TIGR03843 family)
MDHPLIKKILLSGKITLHGQFLRGSNYTFLARAESNGDSIEAVYKPARGEQPLWDFPASSLGKREAAAYEVSQYLGWDLVPPTVYRTKSLPLGAGSLQLFFRHDPKIHYFSMAESERPKLLQVCIFDCLINNADRKGGHVLQDEDGHLWCIDQGLCFNEEDKLRTVIWDFAGQSIPGDLLNDIERLEQALEKNSELTDILQKFLTPVEIGALRLRCLRIVSDPILPINDQHRRMVPYPPL